MNGINFRFFDRARHLILFFIFGFSRSMIASPEDTVENWKCTYLLPQFSEKINRNEVHTIVELGSYIGLDAILLHLYYKCPVYTFDCDISRFEELRNNIADYPQVHFVPYGVWNETKKMTFYIAAFPGASSFYPFDISRIAEREHKTYKELENGGIKMNAIEADAIRLDQWMKETSIDQIDLLCIDVQGASLNALQSLGDHLEQVKYIILEAEHVPIYLNEPLFPRVRSFLVSKGFSLSSSEDYNLFGNFLFINKNRVSMSQ